MKRPKISSTDCVHAGCGPVETDASVTVPIVQSAPFTFTSVRELIEVIEGTSPRKQREYSRMGNPTVAAVERRIAALEGAQKAQLFASGMAAVTTLFLAMLTSGDHMVITRDCYKRTRDFSSEFLSKFGVRVSVVEATLEAVTQAVGDATKIIFTEIPTNPFQYVVDLEGLGALGRRKGIMTVADSTFATPVNLRPLAFGVDAVIHSATKYLGGHNDLVAGVVAGRSEIVEPVSELLMTVGGICDPHTAYLLDRGLKTLALRVEKQNASGLKLAQFLEGHPKVKRVYYCGLPSHPHHAIAKEVMDGFGGVVTFELEADFEKTSRFVEHLQLPVIAPSLGGVESLVEQVVVMGYWDVPPKERKNLGITDSIVRFSLGIEEAEDLIADVEQALAKI